MDFYEILQLLTSNFYIYVGAFVLVLSILVFVHEWGHYIVARLCGVKVETFSIGFGKELFGFNDKRGTRWKVSLVPLGGYVKLFGDVDPASVKHDDVVTEDSTGHVRPLTEAERKVAFFSQPVGRRAMVVVAGPAINYIFAIILFSLVFTFNGQPVTPPSAAAVIHGSAAEKSGFLPHDKIISIDNTRIDDFDDIRREMMIGLDAQKHFIVERGGSKIDIYAKPEKIELSDRFGFKHSIGLLGLISPRHAVEIKNIVKIDGKDFTDEQAVRAELAKRMGTQFSIEVKRGPESDELTILPIAQFNQAMSDSSDPSHDLLFISDTMNNVFIKYSPLVAVQKALQHTWVVTAGTFKALGQIIMGTRSPTELGGVIRIGALAGDMAQQGFIALVLFTALLSINLGLVNLFPIPLLDGGHLVFYAFEALLGRPIPDQIQEYAFRFGLIFLVGIMVFANLNDIMQLIL